MVSHEKAQKAQKEIGEESREVFTVGHSTRSGEEFVQILKAHGVEVLVDVRTFPGSRRYPQFNRVALSESLEKAGIEYRHEPRLGGRRAPRADLP